MSARARFSVRSSRAISRPASLSARAICRGFLPIALSPASVRNVMSDLEQLGLIYAPHTSAGRLPTEIGLRFFVDALMQVGDLTEQDRRSIEAQVAGAHTAKSIEAVLTEASQMLSGLTRSAGVVLTAKNNVRLKHIEFVRLEPERALAVLGCGRRAGRKSRAQCSGRAADLIAHRSGQFSQRAHSRQDTGRPARLKSRKR